MEVAEITLLIGRRGLLLALALGLAAWLAAPLSAVAQKLPAYDAKAGMLAIGKDPEHPDAEIFHIGYTLKGADPAKRPVTFVFNGGPGAASIYLHIVAIGPKTIVTAGDGSFPTAPARLEENPDSWISFTDLVFIDPVGTGYSRMLPGPDGKPGDPKPYYGVDSDLNAIAGFIRQWLTVNKRWVSPKAIAGESYGGLRVVALSRILTEQYGINLNRAVLLSPEWRVPSLAEPFPSYDLLHAATPPRARRRRQESQGLSRPRRIRGRRRYHRPPLPDLPRRPIQNGTHGQNAPDPIQAGRR